MKIKKVKISNFRALENVEIEFSEVTTFVGPNGVGKSTVLNALDWYFNGTPGQLSEADCSYGNSDREIEVSVTFEDLTQKDRNALGKYVTAESELFTAWKTRKLDGSEIFSANAMSYPSFNKVRMAASAKEKKELYSQLQKSNPELDLPKASTQQQIAEALTEWEAANPERLETAPEELQTNFFGFNGQSLMSGLFDFVLVTADLRAAEEAADGKASIIGRILEKTIDRSVVDEEIRAIVEASRKEQQKVYEEKFDDQLRSIGRQIDEAVGFFSKGRSINVRPSPIDIKAPKTTFEVSVADSGIDTEVTRQGHGFQRTLLIASLQVLASSSEVADGGVICLAIEEPELYQHPVQARVFAKVLRSLASNPDRGIQVAYATHSPYFLESKSFHQIRRLVRKTGTEHGVAIYSTDHQIVKQRLAGIVKEKTVDNQLEAMARNTLANAIFANRALIAEGTSDAAVLYGIGDRHEIGILEAYGLEIMGVGSKTNVILAHAILTELGIPTYVLFDGDSGAEERAIKKGKSGKEVADERKNHISLNEKILKYFDMEVVDFPDEQVTKKVAIFGDHLETFLRENWDGWLRHLEILKSEIGLSLSKNHDAYRTVTLRCPTEPPSFLTSILNNSLPPEIDLPE